jgi:cytochrome P450
MRFVSGYDDVLEALRSPLLHMAVADTMAKSDPRHDSSPYLQAVGDMLIFTNPPKHTRIRGVLSRAFTPRMVERLRPRVLELVDQHLDACEATGGPFDLIEHLAGPLPSEVICELLGVPMADQPQVEKWTADIAGTVQPVIPDEALAAGDRTIVEFHDYLRRLVDERKHDPRDDLLSVLVRAEEQEGRLDEDELVSFAVTVLGAGTETTTNLIGVGALALLQSPDQLALMQQDPSRVADAVEELLRFESPVAMAFPRVATADMVLGGEEIVEGELIALLIGAANHDPAVFPDPDRLLIERPGRKPSLAFGQGAPYCMGAALARIEGEIALRRLLCDRMPGLALVDEDLEWRASFNLRGLERLLVRPR